MAGMRKIGMLEVSLGNGVHLKEGERPLQSSVARTPKQMGEMLRRRRRELGYTQQTAADLCAHSARIIGDIERGRGSVGMGVVLDYAMVLGVDLILSVGEAQR